MGEKTRFLMNSTIHRVTEIPHGRYDIILKVHLYLSRMKCAVMTEVYWSRFRTWSVLPQSTVVTEPEPTDTAG